MKTDAFKLATWNEDELHAVHIQAGTSPAALRTAAFYGCLVAVVSIFLFVGTRRAACVRAANGAGVVREVRSRALRR